MQTSDLAREIILMVSISMAGSPSIISQSSSSLRPYLLSLYIGSRVL
jgi:hypothetical protein